MPAVTLKVSGEGDLRALHDAVWEHTRAFLGYYASGESARSFWDFVGTYLQEAQERGLWGPRGADTLVFGMPDFAGTCGRSVALLMHWLQRAWAADPDTLGQVLVEHGFTLRTELDLEPLVFDASERFVRLRRQILQVGDDGLWGDDERIGLEALTEAERAQVEEARARCGCGVCGMLRPDPSFEQQMCAFLEGDDPDAASTAAWYLRHVVQPSPAVLDALVNAGARGELEAVLRTAEALGGRLPAWERLPQRLPNLRGGSLAVAFMALSEARATEAQRQRLLGWLVQALEDEDVVVVAAELVGRQGEGEPELVALLVDLLEQADSDALRHSAVLGLVNLHLPNTPLGPDARRALEAAVRRGGDGADLAKWALAVFGP